MIQVATRHAVAAKVTATVAQPSPLTSRPLTRSPIMFGSFVISIIRNSSGGTEKPCTTPDQTKARIGLKPRQSG